MDDVTRKDYEAPTIAALDVSGETGKGIPWDIEADPYYTTSGPL